MAKRILVLKLEQSNWTNRPRGNMWGSCRREQSLKSPQPISQRINASKFVVQSFCKKTNKKDITNQGSYRLFKASSRLWAVAMKEVDMVVSFWGQNKIPHPLTSHLSRYYPRIFKHHDKLVMRRPTTPADIIIMSDQCHIFHVRINVSAFGSPSAACAFKELF